MSSLVYHSGTRGINFHTRQWFGVPKAFTVLLFKPLLSHTITIPNSLAGNQPAVFTTLVSQSFISPVLLYVSLRLVNDVNFFRAEITHYATNCSWLLCHGQALHAPRPFFNKIRCESHFPKRLEAKKKNPQPHHIVSSQTMSLVCSLQVIKRRNLCICFTGTWVGFFPAHLN